MHAINTGTVEANGVQFAYLHAGDPSGPLALCLHGFPDSAHGWRHLLPALADAGYHAVAPFQRGYAPTSVPADGRYQTGALSVDANALHEALGGDGRAVIIGHDWGAPATFGAAVLEATRWTKVVGMAVPPGGAMGMAFLTNLAQVKRSWYMFFFQHPLSDMVVPANDLAFIDMLWADWSPGHDATDDLPHVKAALRDPANLTAALGYYRATLGDGYRDPALDAAQAATQGIPPQPTLYLHGRTDGCIGTEVAESARAMVPEHVRIHIVEGAGHFLQVEQPGVVNRLVLEFLA
ncbi:MAG: alpha/beta hydrolase [Acidimicrobiaceae bacterium]|nr:alpha/beta hydrolase [Acidimicrobiaceae bacterium]